MESNFYESILNKYNKKYNNELLIQKMDKLLDECLDDFINIRNRNNLNKNDNKDNEDDFISLYKVLKRDIGPKGITTIEMAGDFIYELAELLYKQEAGKITGMILENNIEKLNRIILYDPNELKKLIIDGHNVIKSRLIEQ